MTGTSPYTEHFVAAGTDKAPTPAVHKRKIRPQVSVSIPPRFRKSASGCFRPNRRSRTEARKEAARLATMTSAKILLPLVLALVSLSALPSQSQPLPYSPQWRAWATAKSLSRFQPKRTFSYNILDQSEEPNGTAAPIPKQLESFAQFAADQRRPSWGAAAPKSARNAARKPLTAVDTQFPTADSRAKRVVAAVQLRQGQTPQGYVAETLPQVDARLKAGLAKSGPLKACNKTLPKSQNQLGQARAMLAKEDWAKASKKVLFTKQGIEVCLAAITAAAMDADFGQQELSSAAGLCVAAMEMLTQLRGSQKRRQKTDPVTNVTSEGTKPEHVTSTGSDHQLLVDITGGARIYSQRSFTSGTFSARIKCPSGPSSGSTTSFYLSTPLMDGNRNSIIMEFYGDYKSRVALTTVQNNTNGNSRIVDLGFDCSTEYHTYTLVWSANRIMWYVDKILLQYNDNEGLEVFPSGTSMRLYMSLLYTSTAAMGSWSTGYPRSPILADFKSVKVGTPTVVPPKIPAKVKYSPLFPLSMDYCSPNIETGRGTAAITYDNSGCGGRFHSTIPYQSGFFSTEFKCAKGNTSGLVSSFYLSSGEGTAGQDEIDFEWLGKDKTGVQTNVYVGGVNYPEEWVSLGFDCSDDFHTYDITYNSKKIVWRVDGKIVRTMLAKDFPRYPSQAVFVYGSIWDASSVHYEDWYWAGQWNGGADSPWKISYRNMMFSSPA